MGLVILNPFKSMCAMARIVQILGTLRSDDATATRTSLEKSICVLSVFIAIFPTHLLRQM